MAQKRPDHFAFNELTSFPVELNFLIATMSNISSSPINKFCFISIIENLKTFTSNDDLHAELEHLEKYVDDHTKNIDISDKLYFDTVAY